MGLRDRAARYRRQIIGDKLENLEELYEGKILRRSDLIELKIAINKKLEEYTSFVQRNKENRRSILDVIKKLHSSFKIDELIQITLSIFLEQFHISSVAVYTIDNQTAKIIGQQGFVRLQEFQISSPFVDQLSHDESMIDIKGLKEYNEEYTVLSVGEAKSLIPMKGKEEVVGFIAIGTDYFSQDIGDEERQLFYTVASIIGIEIENATLYQKLDKNCKELSALLEISKIVNTENRVDRVIELVLETLTSGFDVTGIALITGKDDGYVVGGSVGCLIKSPQYELNASEKQMMEQNSVGWVEINPALKKEDSQIEKELFAPLSAGGKTAGALIITEFNRRKVERGLAENINLFSIIASLVSPAIVLSGSMNEIRESFSDPLNPVLERMNQAMHKAKSGGMDITFAMMSLSNFQKYIELYSGEKSRNMLETLFEKIRSIMPVGTQCIRYTLSRMLFILPAMSESDVDDFKDFVIASVKTVFKSETEVEIAAQILTSKYPQQSEESVVLLSMLE